MDIIQFFIDFVLHIDSHLLELVMRYGTWIYLILFIIVFCETGLVVVPFLPGDSLLFAAGVLAGAGLMGYFSAMGIFLLAGASGDCVNYILGHFAGPAIFRKEHRFIKKEYLIAAHAFYERHGGKAIILARFIPIIRTFAPFVAGIARMHPYVFFFYNIIGCISGWEPSCRPVTSSAISSSCAPTSASLFTLSSLFLLSRSLCQQ